MSRIKKHISILVFTASIFGLFLSMVHSHSDGLECLYHAEDQHITENELLCPVCGITSFSEPVSLTAQKATLFFISNVFEVEVPSAENPLYSLLPSRGPPAVTCA